jgi:acetyl-CoA carboxylase carboxyl transferase subunit beta
MVYRPDPEAAQRVTPSGVHMRIGRALRFAYAFDDSRFEALPAPANRGDPLQLAT